MADSVQQESNYENDIRQFFDKIDLRPFFIVGKEISEIMDEIEYIYEKQFQKQYPHHHYLFNKWNEYDFMDYVYHKYKINFREILTYRVC